MGNKNRLFDVIKDGDSNRLELYAKEVGLETYLEEYRSVIKEYRLQLPLPMASLGHAQVRNGLIWSKVLYGICSNVSNAPYFFSQNESSSTVVFTSVELAKRFLESVGSPAAKIITLVNDFDENTNSSKYIADRKYWLLKSYHFGADSISVNPELHNVNICIDISQVLIMNPEIIPGLRKEEQELTRSMMFYLYYVIQESNRIEPLSALKRVHKELLGTYLMLACDRDEKPILFCDKNGNFTYYGFSNLDDVGRIGEKEINQVINFKPVQLGSILQMARQEKVKITINPFTTNLTMSYKLLNILT